MVSRLPVITGAGQAFPPAVAQSELWDGFFRAHYRNSPLARRLFSSAGPRQRHALISPLVEDASHWSTETRMKRYLPGALPLATAAVNDALSRAGLAASDIGLLVVASCTGYATPGVDTFVARDTGMRASVQRLMVGHMGCHAALPALSAATDYVTVHERPAVVVCVELGSLHLQPPTTDPEQMVAHALFSDAASAIVVEPNRPGGLEVLDSIVVSDVENNHLMTWNVTDLGFRMGLSQQIPDAMEPQVRPLIDKLLASHSASADGVAGWALHPGGPRIIDAVERVLKLDSDALSESRGVLAERGNCSSSTVLLVLDQVRSTRVLNGGDHVVMLAFGPGLTLAATLLRVAQ